MLYTELRNTVTDAGRLKKKKKKDVAREISSSREGSVSVNRLAKN